ncbi:MAG: 2,3-bisphosphoglycerate-independent phosphoglycerate mutase [Parcubacteria group bacterium]|nr:2,3-bisphosphoglycerate-independent phosphoglycerate mutase [Parcubacteria group bacterium]MCR4343094.1 2,3-bisphosphoglycerate-independent phosphoglycerate mutase [Patescibacteria group bacterium]
MEMPIPDQNKRYKPVVLIVMDGFGVGSNIIESPWELALHPFFIEVERDYPFAVLQASGTAVGLPWNEPGNSEVGHLTMGSGKIIYTHLPRISVAIDDGSLFKNEVLKKAVSHIENQPEDKKTNLHFMGLFSSGSVHAHASHLYALLDYAKQKNIKRVFLHLFSDGRDASLKEGSSFFKELEYHIEKQYPFAKIASVIGRKYSMDRDGDWEKTELAYNLFVEGRGDKFKSASSYINENYEKGITDESIGPACLETEDESSCEYSRIKDNDAVIFFNFREDSVRQLTEAFTIKSFDKFARKDLSNLFFATMTEYNKNFNLPVIFPPIENKYPLARAISDAGLSQIHIAETEKYAHVTYFFNGGKEEPFPMENRILINSPETTSFELKPEMSADKVADTIIENITKYDFILANFANADMVGHTGNFEATIKAMETLDREVGRVAKAIEDIGGVIIITGDHGNAEEKIYKLTGEKRTKHTTNSVPFYLIGKDFKKNNPLSQEEIKEKYKRTDGILIDVAPTILNLLSIEKPSEMTGNSLLKKLSSTV